MTNAKWREDLPETPAASLNSITPLRRLYKETLIDPDGIRSSEPPAFGRLFFFAFMGVRAALIA
jgi:hypothetical protein